jgi:hypothetical protein
VHDVFGEADERIVIVKVGTPFGEVPFEYRRTERREGGLAIVGIVAGLESSVVLDRGDLAKAGGALAGLALVAVLLNRAGR